VLHGAVQPHSGSTTPRAMEKALARSRDPFFALQITVEATVQVQVHVIGALGFGQPRLAVDCGVTTAGLKKGVHISSQTCKSAFRK
jgi:hypothetical protein